MQQLFLFSIAWYVDRKQKRGELEFKDEAFDFPKINNYKKQTFTEIQVDKRLDKNEIALVQIELNGGDIGEDQMNAVIHSGRATAFNIGFNKGKRVNSKHKGFAPIDFRRVIITNKKIHLDSEPYQKPISITSVSEISYFSKNSVLITWRNLYKIKIIFKNYNDATDFGNWVFTVLDETQDITVDKKVYNKFNLQYKRPELINYCEREGLDFSPRMKKGELITILVSAGYAPERKK